MLTVSWPALRACLCMGIKPSRVTLFAQTGVGSTPRLDSDVARLVDHNGLLRLPTRARCFCLCAEEIVAARVQRYSARRAPAGAPAAQALRKVLCNGPR